MPIHRFEPFRPSLTRRAAAAALAAFAAAIAVAAEPAGSAVQAVGAGPSAAPSNDAFVDAAPISGASGAATGTNVDATAELDEPDHAGIAAAASVWYRWTAPAAGTVTFDLCESDFDTVLAVYVGSTLDGLVPVQANDDSHDAACGVAASRVSFHATAGAEYRIAVDGYAGATGPFVLRWSPPRPTNVARPAVSGVAQVGESLAATPGEWASALPVAHRYQWQRCGRLDYPALNVARGSPVYATGSTPDHPPVHAVDGEFLTYWSAGDHPPQWLEIDLGAPYPVSTIRAAITQLPDGFTVHHIDFKGPQPADTWLALVKLAGTTRDQQVLEWVAPTGWLEDVQFLRVVTNASPSWVGWREIEAYTNCVSVPGATASTYVATTADVGYMLRVVVTATSAAGATAAASARTLVVPPLPQDPPPPPPPPPVQQFPLTVINGSRGTVTSSPPGIGCGTDCVESYDAGTVVTLTAAADPGAEFTGWDGACSGMSATCTVRIVGATSVGATFIPRAVAPPKRTGVRKVAICHKGRTIKVTPKQARAHRKHGDRMGPCKKKKKKKRRR